MADKYVKEENYAEARAQLNKAHQLDPSNAYVIAFEERIKHFETLKSAQISKKFVQPEPLKPSVPPEPVVHRQPTEKFTPTPKFTPPPPVPKFTPALEPAPTSPNVNQALDAMRKQIEELTKTLEQEKKAREEVLQKNIEQGIIYLRSELRKLWVHGSPEEKDELELKRYAEAHSISDEVYQKIRREVKIEMYASAVKEVIAKRKLLRNSSSTLEWLRKVYQISMNEYLENESHFLLDLVSDQFKGTMILIINEQKDRDVYSLKFKSSGFAVVSASTPEQALEKIEKIFPTIILSNVSFPDGSLSGIKFLHLIRLNTKVNFIPFILLGSQKDKEKVSQTELRPNETFVAPPIDFDELSATINEKIRQFRDYISAIA
jgi:tetratricopeptide (TPR) repeat protein